ncbi:hypothetical protein ABT154_20125 [Streptomyces sp. NPDC001728]|uniref:hypothetical protein n=1 Tax=Streptomyces sp. NPDC001728 TaxID=3154396 RepID=UPI003333A845
MLLPSRSTFRLRSWSGLGHGVDAGTYGADVLRKSGHETPCRFLRLEVQEAVRLGVLDGRFSHGSFPADALLAGCFDLVEPSAFGGVAAEGDLLRDLG